LLADHEQLVLDLRPHWIALVWPAAQAIVIIIGFGVVWRYTPDTWPEWVYLAELGLVLLLLLAYPVRRLVAWLTSHFVVTSDRVIQREGWFAKKSMEMPLERINDVRFKQSVFERIVGAGDLVIESGGEFGQNRFTDIRKPEDVQKTIYEMSEKNQARPVAAAAPTRPTDRFEADYRTTETVERPPSVTEQLERLADLRERGVINEAEFQEAKERVLGDAPE
jgi:uncharacterized membrane protein YdbT with pleckstrin-like domain